MMDHWTADDLAACAEMDTLFGLARLAIAMLDRLKLETKCDRIYQICGPMSTGGLGNLQDNMILFKEAIVVAREKGWIVFNQVPFQDAMIRIVKYYERKDYAQEILDEFYLPVFESHRIACAPFIPYWHTSKGAAWEREKVGSLGHIMVFDYPAQWYRLALKRVGLPLPVAA